ncbi:MAG: pectin esterase [Gammaproteobacteria bacterium]|nr:pectin esterase [Gammaproteobacteria bacterium]
MMRSVLLCVAVFAAGIATASADFVVAHDGSGDFRTIQTAIDAMKSFPPERITIRVKPGVYREKVVVHEWNTRLSLIGESAADTVISGDEHFKRVARGRNSTLFTPTMQVDADDFVAKNLTIENTAGDIGQAIALTVNANRAVFRNVRLLGNQDTLYVTGEGNRMLFDNCYVEGTTDFIFGGASAVFRDCRLHAKKNSYITAASTPAGAGFGFVFINATLTAAPGVDAVYLGRPWREHAQTVFIDSTLGPHILPAGWHDWDKPEARRTVLYGEHASAGPGAGTEGRVSWSRQLDPAEAARYETRSLLESATHPDWHTR